ncbi:MAG: hypothetical protein VYE61_01765, partial [Pseudomonadota bacterium]|nr:hypothetical protein [Pseudomonadota bacterium]
MSAVTEAALCDKIHCIERFLSEAQVNMQQTCTIEKADGEPDLSKVVPCFATVARFVFNRSACHIFTLDWTNKLYHTPVPIHSLGRMQPRDRWLTKMDQNDVMPAVLAQPGFSFPQNIIAAGAFIGSILETRDRPFDGCVSLAVNIGTERKPYWVNQRWDHVVMSYLKTSTKKPATEEQAQRMYPGNPCPNIVEDDNAYLVWQPERENPKKTFLINLYTMKQVVGQDTANKQATRREMRWNIRTEF